MRLLRARPARLLALVAAAALLVSACGSDVEAVAVGDESLSRGELDEILDDLAAASAVPDADPAAQLEVDDDADEENRSIDLASQFLSTYVFWEAFAGELAERGYEVGESELQLAAQELEAQNPPFAIDSVTGEAYTRIIAVQMLVDTWLQAETPELDLDLDPDTFYVPPATPEYICSSHILLESEEDAEAAVERLDDGEDFAELAMELSTGPTGPDGGDLGCVDTAGFVAEFVDGAREVAPSGRTGPVESQFGWHVIEVRSFGPLTAENHPELSADEVQAILDQAEESARALADQQVAEIEASALQEQQAPLIEEVQLAVFERIERDLELDPRYGEWSTESVAVVPPSGVETG